ncbi:hypothetical protein PBCV1_a152L [Paramecium bursaria Chlorella virus 1]|uniref:Uncharacterized protein n=1 Tax=Paramecium bursaria Chlorella virus 1 TaxID=10506 RepID=Q84472_PBCV1|nr:hypothetical protein PBCV1_a152L [Paramecium bursaria Chlorella virus 1]AAC96520.1 hypothetical protein [Paramecium bursaria Chlorella virus 1]
MTSRSRVSFAQYRGRYTWPLSFLKTLNFFGNTCSRVKGETVSSLLMSFFSCSVRSAILILTPSLDKTPGRLMKYIKIVCILSIIKASLSI